MGVVEAAKMDTRLDHLKFDVDARLVWREPEQAHPRLLARRLIQRLLPEPDSLLEEALDHMPHTLLG